MPLLFRDIDRGNSNYRLWLEDSGRAATITIDSEPQLRFPIHEGDEDGKIEAIKRFREWLEFLGIDPALCRGTKLMIKYEEARAKYNAGALTAEEYRGVLFELDSMSTVTSYRAKDYLYTGE